MRKTNRIAHIVNNIIKLMNDINPEATPTYDIDYKFDEGGWLHGQIVTDFESVNVQDAVKGVMFELNCEYERAEEMVSPILMVYLTDIHQWVEAYMHWLSTQPCGKAGAAKWFGEWIAARSTIHNA